MRAPVGAATSEQQISTDAQNVDVLSWYYTREIKCVTRNHRLTSTCVAMYFLSIGRQPINVFVPLVVSLSRARNVPLWFPVDSRIRSASLRPILPKYHLPEEKESDSPVGPPL